MGLCRSNRDRLFGWVPLHLGTSDLTGVAASDAGAIVAWADSTLAVVTPE